MAESRIVSAGSEMESLLRERRGGLEILTLNRPGRLNALDEGLLGCLTTALVEIAADPEVRVLVLTGAGRGFCAGGDLAEGPGGDIGAGGSAAERTRGLRAYMESSRLLREMPAVTVAAVNGACAGAGLALAAACDLRFAAETAVFRSSFLSAGVSGDFGGAWTLGHLVGGARLRELYLLNEKLTAADAYRIGLVSGVLPAQDFVGAVTGRVQALTSGPPLALRGMKANLNDAEECEFATSMDREAERHAACLMSQDAAEAARAFAEKRRPVFSGA